MWRVGAFLVYLYKLRRLNGPNCSWAFWMFSDIIPEKILGKMGKIYIGKPLKTKNRKELLASIRPSHWRYLRPDNGDMPDGYAPPPPKTHASEPLRVIP